MKKTIPLSTANLLIFTLFCFKLFLCSGSVPFVALFSGSGSRHEAGLAEVFPNQPRGPAEVLLVLLRSSVMCLPASLS